jgi:hypothetical protein
VINWINALKNAGYITVEYARASGAGENTGRRAIRIRDRDIRIMNFFSSSGENGEEKGVQTAAENIRKVNIFSPSVKEFSPKTENSFPQKDENSFTHISTSTNKATTTAAGLSADSRPEAAAAGFANRPEEKEIPAETVQGLKDALAAVDRGLVLKNSFYPRAAAFMAENGLDRSYLSWLYALCLSKKPRSLDGLFFTLFFEDNIAGMFKARRAPPPPVIAVCPVCGTSHEKNLDCPACGTGRFASREDIDCLKRVRSLPPDVRAASLAEEQKIRLSGSPFRGFQEKNARLNALREKYGVGGTP